MAMLFLMTEVHFGQPPGPHAPPHSQIGQTAQQAHQVWGPFPRCLPRVLCRSQRHWSRISGTLSRVKAEG